MKRSQLTSSRISTEASRLWPDPIAGDTTERLIAILDTWDGDADRELNADAEPSLTAPKNHHASQIVCMRESEARAPETVLPEVIRSPVPRV